MFFGFGKSTRGPTPPPETIFSLCHTRTLRPIEAGTIDPTRSAFRRGLLPLAGTEARRHLRVLGHDAIQFHNLRG